ncbi:hypothetical protein T265_03965 [Opisthorchis viverrini]|uniref:Uncharacterized protein n=1 Tax=Opisthorchis viverrini TaxID=6198 RepID=A0A075A1F9_OPIVI|nr:hypothetical protein T265_03965 [Opisthorchis viverrini]KER29395.1 hypothetical protein T265_03965 [Opisthorchis viverrini]
MGASLCEGYTSDIGLAYNSVRCQRSAQWSSCDLGLMNERLRHASLRGLRFRCIHLTLPKFSSATFYRHCMEPVAKMSTYCTCIDNYLLKARSLSVNLPKLKNVCNQSTDFAGHYCERRGEPRTDYISLQMKCDHGLSRCNDQQHRRG